MSIITYAQAFLAIIILGFLWQKIGRRGLLIIGLIVALALASSFVFLHTLQTSDQVATVKCSMVTNREHVMVIELNGATHELGGDRWLLQSTTVEVQPYMHFMGVKSAHMITRLDSEFDNPNHSTEKPVVLSSMHFEDIQPLLLLPIIRSSYQSGVVENCNGTYDVSADSNGDLSAHRA